MSNVFPQNGDNDSGSNFSIWLDRENISNYIHTGIEFINVDYTNLTFDLSEGHCFVSHNHEDKVVYIEPSEFAGIALSDNATNHVFLDVDFGTNNSVSVVVNTTSNAPAGAWIKVGTVDTSANSVNHANRDPIVRARSATLDSVEVNGDITDDTSVIWNRSAQFVPQAQVEQGSGSGLDSDTVDGSHAADLGSAVSDDGTTIVSPATDINFATNINVTDDGDGTVTVDGSPGTSVSEDGMVVVDGVTDINFSTNLNVTDDLDGTVTIDVDEGAGSGLDADTLDGVQLANINWANVAMAQSDVNVSDLGTADSDLSMGGNNILAINSIDFNNREMSDFSGMGGGEIYHDRDYSADFPAITGGAGIGGIAVYDDNWSAIISTENMVAITANFDAIETTGNITDTSGTSSTTIWDTTAGYVPASSIEQGAGSGLNADLLDGSSSAAFAHVSGDTFTGNVTLNDDVLLNLGTGGDFSFSYDSLNNRLTLEHSSGTQLMHATGNGVIDFPNGIDVGIIESPTDTYTELIDTDVTPGTTSGDVTGYTFAVNSQTILGIEGIANGTGGLQNKKINFNQNEAENFVMDLRAADPPSPTVGQMWYRTDLD